jgi:hypothetical protein
MADRCLAAIGNYTISKLKLGKGSFSTVKLARHNNLGSDVAMKIIVLSRIKGTVQRKLTGVENRRK